MSPLLAGGGKHGGGGGGGGGAKFWGGLGAPMLLGRESGCCKWLEAVRLGGGGGGTGRLGGGGAAGFPIPGIDGYDGCLVGTGGGSEFDDDIGGGGGGAWLTDLFTASTPPWFSIKLKKEL